MTVEPYIESPCISVCVLDDATGYCKGCLRTRSEIAGWSRADAAAKRAILESLHGRRVAGGGEARRETRRRQQSPR